MAKLALVTGASSGIGKAFAQRLAAEGHDLIVTGRREDRLTELASALSGVAVEPLVADLATDEGLQAVADLCRSRPLATLINNAGVAHYMPFSELPDENASELIRVKGLAPTLLALAAVPGMLERGEGTIVNVSGMIAFSGPAGPEQMPRRAVYTGTLAYLLAWTQQLHAELASEGLRVQVLCPGVVATEFHERQGIDLSAVPRMSPEDVVTASVHGLQRGEVVCAPGVERADLLQAVFGAQLAAFGAQSPELAARYR
jgi:short-subunit dehydrogenase